MEGVVAEEGEGGGEPDSKVYPLNLQSLGL